MARLSSLVVATAAILGLDVESVYQRARHLREAGLIRQGGRGTSAPHMGPSDAANLVLGVMASPSAKDSPECVRLIRSAKFEECEVNLSGRVIDDVPPFAALKARDRVLKFGPALERIIDQAVKHGDLKMDDGALIANLDIRADQPGLRGEIYIDTGSSIHVVRYQRPDPRLEKLHGEALINEARAVQSERRGLRTMTSISIAEIHRIADVLAAPVRPPYQRGSRDG